jgi:serine/threonine protein kinase
VTSTTDGKEGYYWKGGKQVKGERVDYRRFNVLVGGQNITVLELEEVLGCGANATVRNGRDPRSCQRYAVKVYEKYKLVEVKKKKRVMQEIEILSKLDHCGIIKLVHCFEDKRQIHLLFEFIEGAQTLQEFIRANAYSVPEK